MNNKNMRLYDISMPICRTMPTYRGSIAKKPIHEVEGDHTTGKVYESSIKMNLHTGTHMDGSLHMMEGGKTVDLIPLDEVITECKVLDLTFVHDKITKADLEDKNIQAGDFILLKTKNSYEDILENNFIYVDRDGAKYLAELNIKGVGIDSLGIERSQPDHETHLSLMREGIHILEGLRLKDISEGEYFLFAAPINIQGAEAAPVRAVLMKQL